MDDFSKNLDVPPLYCIKVQSAKIGEMENTLQLANCQEITKKLSNVWLEILNLIFLTRFLMLLK